MKIGIDVRSLLSPYQTGVGQFTRGLLSALSQHTDHTYYLYYNAAKHNAPPTVTEFGTVVTSRYPNKLLTLTSGYTNWPKIDTIIQRQEDVDIDLLFSPHTQFAAHTRHVPHVMTIPDLSFEHFPQVYDRKQRLWHWFHRVKHQAVRAAAIVVPSESTKDDVSHSFGVDDDKIHVVYPGISQEAYRAVSEEEIIDVQNKYHLPSRFFLFLGTLEPRKNIDTLIEAFAYSNLGPEEGYELIIAGAPGWQNATLKKQIEHTHGVRYIGYVEESEKAVLYHLARAVAYPSIFEGFGFPVLEAMAQGTSVLTSSRTSLPEVARGQAVCVHPYRIDDMADALIALKDGKKLEAHIAVARSYTWEHAAKELQTTFETYAT